MKASSAASKRARSSAPRAAPPAPRQPFSNLRFQVTIADIPGTGAVEVVFPTARIVTLPRKRRTVQFSPLVIRRGLTRSTDWYDWWNRARRSARGAQRLVQVHLLDADGSSALRWVFPDSLPLGYELSPLNALAGAPVIETLELQVGDFVLFQRQ